MKKLDFSVDAIIRNGSSHMRKLHYSVINTVYYNLTSTILDAVNQTMPPIYSKLTRLTVKGYYYAQH